MLSTNVLGICTYVDYSVVHRPWPWRSCSSIACSVERVCHIVSQWASIDSGALAGWPHLAVIQTCSRGGYSDIRSKSAQLRETRCRWATTQGRRSRSLDHDDPINQSLG